MHRDMDIEFALGTIHPLHLFITSICMCRQKSSLCVGWLRIVGDRMEMENWAVIETRTSTNTLWHGPCMNGPTREENRGPGDGMKIEMEI